MRGKSEMNLKFTSSCNFFRKDQGKRMEAVQIIVAYRYGVHLADGIDGGFGIVFYGQFQMIHLW